MDEEDVATLEPFSEVAEFDIVKIFIEHKLLTDKQMMLLPNMLQRGIHNGQMCSLDNRPSICSVSVEKRSG